MTAPQLAGRFGRYRCAPSTGDIDALSAAGVPVYTTQGKGGGVPLMDHYTLHRAAFTEEEQRAAHRPAEPAGADRGRRMIPGQAVRPVPPAGDQLAPGGAVPLGGRRGHQQIRPAQGPPFCTGGRPPSPT